MPSNHTDYQREYMRRYRAQGRERTSIRSFSRLLEFVGCDGEGYTLPDNGYHAYFLLRIGEQSLRPKPNNTRLTTIECLDFIASQDPNKIYVGYFFDYDITKILEDLPFKKMERLVKRDQRLAVNGRLYPIDYFDFQIEYLPRKELKVRKIKTREESGEIVWGPWVTINDVGPFFQTSFLAAIKAWKVGTEDEWFQIEDGKTQRATFNIRDIDEIDRYNALEVRLLQQLMEKFRQACIDTGYVPKKWQGPGQLAEAMFAAHGVKKSRDVPLLQDERYKGLVQFGLNAFYGGRTEITAVGPVDNVVYQYDINSAYPYAMQFLPCLDHGNWTHYDTNISPEEMGSIYRSLVVPTGKVGERYAICFGSFENKERVPPLVMCYPMRTSSGTIVYPAAGSGWYWSFECHSAIHQIFEPKELWMYERTCECAPLSFVNAVYRKRQIIGKDGPGIVLKLAMNSLYGKTVQSIGMPKYANPIWGSFILAYTRMMIQNFIHGSPYCKEGRCGYDILMMATDSIATTTYREDIHVSSALGDWSLDIHKDGMFIVQPGVYFGSSVDSKGTKKRPKTRGVPLHVIEGFEDLFRAKFIELVRSGNIADASVYVPQKLFVGLRSAVHRHNTRLAGQWVEFKDGDKVGKEISFDWTSKRAMFPALAPNKDRSYILTFPYLGNKQIVTTPYNKNIGGLLDREKQRIPFYDQPDWSSAIEMEINDGE